MNNTIALTQFVFLSLCLMALNIVVKTTHEPTPLAQFLARDGWWLFVIPVAWIALDAMAGAVGGEAFRKVSRGLGVLLAAAILCVYGYAIFFPEIQG